MWMISPLTRSTTALALPELPSLGCTTTDAYVPPRSFRASLPGFTHTVLLATFPPSGMAYLSRENTVP